MLGPANAVPEVTQPIVVLCCYAKILPYLDFYTEVWVHYFWLVLFVTPLLSEKKSPNHQNLKMRALFNIHIIFFWAGGKKFVNSIY